MAIIDYKELIEIIIMHPEYKKKWELDVPAEEDLAISFGDSHAKCLESTVMDICDGGQLIIDVDKNGIVHSIEIA